MIALHFLIVSPALKVIGIMLSRDMKNMLTPFAAIHLIEEFNLIAGFDGSSNLSSSIMNKFVKFVGEIIDLAICSSGCHTLEKHFNLTEFGIFDIEQCVQRSFHQLNKRIVPTRPPC